MRRYELFELGCDVAAAQKRLQPHQACKQLLVPMQRYSNQKATMNDAGPPLAHKQCSSPVLRNGRVLLAIHFCLPLVQLLLHALELFHLPGAQICRSGCNIGGADIKYVAHCKACSRLKSHWCHIASMYENSYRVSCAAGRAAWPTDAAQEMHIYAMEAARLQDRSDMSSIAIHEVCNLQQATHETRC